ncbi:MAG: hypothetical protein WCC57_04860 [Paracoccaceae bacterium]
MAIRSRSPITFKPTRLSFGPDGWAQFGPPLIAPVSMADWGDINISRAPLA